MTLGRRLQSLDRRALYLLLALTIALPMVLGAPVPPAAVSPEAHRFYDTIERLAADPVESKKLVLIGTNYGAGTLAENQTQLEAVVRHLVRHRFRIALLSFADPQGRDLGQRVLQSLATPAGYVYGKDWVNFGYRPWGGIDQVLKSASTDLPGTVANEIQGAAVGTLPVMEGVRSADDIAAVVNIASTDSLEKWLSFFPRPSGEPLVLLFCPTGVMATEAYPLLRSGQLQGMLPGLRGSIEYEGLLQEAGFATRLSASLSYAHFLIIGLVIVGNIGMFLERRGH
jgi:hypothetical protein